MSKFLKTCNLLIFLVPAFLLNGQHLISVIGDWNETETKRVNFNYYQPLRTSSFGFNYHFEKKHWTFGIQFNQNSKGFKQDVFYTNASGEIFPKSQLETWKFNYLGLVPKIGWIHRGDKWLFAYTAGIGCNRFTKGSVTRNAIQINDTIQLPSFFGVFYSLQKWNISFRQELELGKVFSNGHSMGIRLLVEHSMITTNFKHTNSGGWRYVSAGVGCFVEFPIRKKNPEPN